MFIVMIVDVVNLSNGPIWITRNYYLADGVKLKMGICDVSEYLQLQGHDNTEDEKKKK